MKLIIFSLIIAGVLTVVSCSNKSARDQQHSFESNSQDSQQVNVPKTPPGGAPPAAIKPNSSEVLAEIIDIKQLGVDDFLVTAKTLEVKENPAYPSIAAVNNVYELKPNFVLGENNEIVDNQRNKNLMNLKNLKKGDNFRAVIFLNDDKHWMIREVVDK